MLAPIFWQDVRQLSHLQLPATVRPWLLDSGSLTQRLIEASQGNFHVQCLSQRWQVPTLDEARLLQMKPRQVALVREVFLCCHDVPWVYARSVLPVNSLSGSLGFLRKLKDSALGGLLFKDPYLQRSVFEVADIQLPCHIIPFASDERIHGRRSLFFLRRHPLLVAEFFLPECQLGTIDKGSTI